MSNQLPRAKSPSTSKRPYVDEQKRDENQEEPKKEPVLSSYASASSSASTLTLPSPATAKQRVVFAWRRITTRDYLMEDIDPTDGTFLFWCFSFMSGLINSVPFTAILIWCGFQTGNTVQLGIAIGRLLTTGEVSHKFEVADQQALLSLLSYLAGGFIARYGNRVGPNKRAWLTFGTFLQALFTMAAAITVWKGGDPSVAGLRGEDAWASTLSFISLGFASASMGLQGVMARRIGSHFGSTLVLTTLWAELMGDPDLFRRGYVKSRDHRLLAVLAFLMGGMIGRGILNHQGSAAVFGIATGLRVLLALFWLFVPSRN